MQLNMHRHSACACTHNVCTYWQEISHMHRFTDVKVEEVLADDRCVLANSQEWHVHKWNGHLQLRGDCTEVLKSLMQPYIC